ncbi:hypothetical protein FTX61_18380 [Nitriliruptoraceae bacterium ZYF776]|nr:hypothetical protein [Profundirhabdus halotolerans]
MVTTRPPHPPTHHVVRTFPPASRTTWSRPAPHTPRRTTWYGSAGRARRAVHRPDEPRGPAGPGRGQAPGMRSSDLYALSAVADHCLRIGDAALALGVPAREIRRVLARDGWHQPFRDVALAPGVPLDARNLARAAVASVGGEVAIGGWSALHLLGARRSAPSTVQVTVPAARHLRPRNGIEVTRSRTWRPSDVVLHDGVPVLGGARLVLGLAAVADLPTLRSAAIDLRFRGHLDLEQLELLLDAAGPMTGIATCRQVLEDLETAGRTDSPIELDIRQAAAGRGIRFDRGQGEIALVDGGTIDLDLVIRHLYLGVKVHGYGFHSSPDQLDRDAARDVAIAKIPADWRVLVVTWNRWQRDREGFLDDLVDVAMHQRRRLGHLAA